MLIGKTLRIVSMISISIDKAKVKAIKKKIFAKGNRGNSKWQVDWKE